MVKEILMLLFACVVTNNICCAQGIGVLEVQNPKRNAAYVAFISIAVTILATITAIGYYYLNSLLLEQFDLGFLKIFILTVIVGIFAFIVSGIAKKVNKEVTFLFDQNYSFLTIIAVTVGILLLVDFSQSILFVVLSAFFYGLGFLVINFMFYAFEERMQIRSVNVVFRSLPIILFTLAFIGMLLYAISMFVI